MNPQEQTNPTSPILHFVPPPRPRPPKPAPEPFTREEIAACWSKPFELVDLVLGGSGRIAANVARGQELGALVIALLAASTLFALPYGLAINAHAWWDSWWRIVVFYLGSTLICVPALHVFSSFLGLRVSLAQMLVFALMIPAAAALFTFGFAPILGFLRATGDPESEWISWRTVSIVLLSFTSLAAVVQLWRCLAASKGLPSRWRFAIVMFAWHWLFIDVLLRMGSVLDL